MAGHPRNSITILLHSSSKVNMLKWHVSRVMWTRFFWTHLRIVTHVINRTMNTGVSMARIVQPVIIRQIGRMLISIIIAATSR